MLLLFAVAVVSLPAAFHTGTWSRYVPLKASVGSGGDIYGYLDELKRTKQTLVGLGASSCEEVASFVEFLDAAAQHYPSLLIFASLSSHAPIFEYCSSMLNDGGDDVDWTRVGRYLGNATGTRTNFQGIYIDDFYVIMCTPDKTTYVRHASSEIRPCLHMDAMVAMRDAMREHAPKAQFLPLVYNDNLGYALPGAHGLGAPEGVRFVPPATTSATFSFVAAPRTGDAYVLRFFFKNMLQAWERGDIKNTTFTNIANFRALVDGHVVLDVDASSGVSVQMFKQDVTSELLGSLSVSRELKFEVVPSAKAATTPGSQTSDRCTFVFGVELRRQSDGVDVLNHSSVRYSAASPGSIAESSNSSSVLDVADAIIVQQAQPPVAFVAANYSELMAMVKRQASKHHTSVIGGHYARMGLRWRVPVSSAQITQSINIDRSLGLSGALVWNEAVELAHCPSPYTACNEGIFAERALHAGGHRFTHQLMWPDDTLCMPGWFARYQTTKPLAQGSNLTVWLNDNLKQKGNRSAGLFSIGMFVLRVHGAHTNRTYYQRSAGYSSNTTCVTGGDAVPCPAPPGAQTGGCQRQCSGVNGADERLNLILTATEPIAVSMSAGRGCSHTLMMLRLGLGEAVTWTFESGVDDQYLDPSIRAVYNATLAGFVVN